jgi:hypothetical protein
MFRIFVCCVPLLLVVSTVTRAEPPKEGDKLIEGMSIVGNDDAPKSLAIVPWKGSKLGDTLSVSRALDDGRQPVDKAVFMRELDYYQIRAGSNGARSSAPQ